MKNPIKIAAVLFLFLAILPRLGAAQTDSAAKPLADTSWKHHLNAYANFTQVSFTDWSQGGENALSYALGAEGSAIQELPKTQWATTYRFAFGQARLSQQGLRKTDDKIDLETKLVYKIGTYLNPFVAVNARTQFTTGYSYDAATNQPTPISDFMDPLYALQSIGFGYQPEKAFKTRLGLALQEIFVKNYTLYTDDPATPTIEKSKVEGGLESVTDVEVPLDDNVLFKSKLEMFAPFKHLDVVVVRSDNTIVAKISKYFSANLNVQFVNDANVSPRTQIKEALAIGINYSVF